MIGAQSRLDDLRRDFLAGSTVSMPIAGIIFWAAVAVAAQLLPPGQLATAVLFGSGAIFPLGVLIDRLRGRNLLAAGTKNPLDVLFLRSLAMVIMLWPLVGIAANAAADPTLVVLGGALLMGVIWIPYGWAAGDPAGLQHAVIRAILSYAAFLLAPAPHKASAIAVAVLLSYAFSLVRMRRPEPLHA